MKINNELECWCKSASVISSNHKCDTKINIGVEQVIREEALQVFIESGALATNELPNFLRDAIFRAGFKAARSISINEIRILNSFFEEDWNEKLDELSIEELRSRVILIHSWVKLHQYQVEKANVDKNFYKSQLQEKDKEIKELKEKLNNSMNFHCPHFVTTDNGYVACDKFPNQEEVGKVLESLEELSNNAESRGIHSIRIENEKHYEVVKKLLEKLK